MVRTASRPLVALLVLSSLLLGSPSPGRGAEWRDVSDARLANAEHDAGNWLMYNRTYAGWRFSPLDQISAANVKKLVPKWIFAGGTVGDQQMTPVVNDGVMFTTSTALAFNRVHAMNAATGELLWKHDRRIPDDVGALVRLIPHNRGVALHKDKVIFGTLDAHLVALDAKTGKPAWETKIADYAEGYFVSQAPLVIKGKVVVGIAGPGEMGPRGFVEAFDADSGKSQWRWYSIPSAGEPGSETWAADTWKIGGGAVWHTGTYDPATNLLYVGTGNPAPWIADMRKGDNLYTMSAVAVDVDSGKMKWFHQYLANEPWDYDTVAEHHVIDASRHRRRAEWTDPEGRRHGEQARVRLHARPDHGQVPLRGPLHQVTDLGRTGSGDRQGRGEARAPADDGWPSGRGVSVAARRHRLAAEGLQPEDRVPLHPVERVLHEVRVRAGPDLQEGPALHREHHGAFQQDGACRGAAGLRREPEQGALGMEQPDAAHQSHPEHRR